jgi:HK97 family phage major capsid protein
MAEETKKTEIEVKEKDPNALVKEVRELAEKKEKDVLDKEKEAKLDAALDKFEKKSEELAKKLIDEQEKNANLSEKIEIFEKQLTRLPAGGKNGLSIQEGKKAFNAFIKTGEVDEIGKKYIRTDSNPDGGALTSYDIIPDLIKDITEISPVRQVARVDSTDKIGTENYQRSSLVTVYMVGEGNAATASNSKYQNLKIPVLGMMGEVQITQKAAMQSGFDFETEARADLIEAFAQLEGQLFVKGNGATEPMGFMTSPLVSSINSGIADDIDYDSIIDLTGQVKTGYNPVFGFNRLTRARIRKLKDGSGSYIWQAGNLAAGIPNSVEGYSYFEMPDMDNIGAGLYPVVFGDFKKGYNIVEGTQMLVQRNPYRLSGYIILEMTRFIGGDVRTAEALKKLKCSV